jgi:predicted DNA-binding ribbon-helix-helix protein
MDKWHLPAGLNSIRLSVVNISTETELSDAELIDELQEAYYQPEQLTTAIKAQIVSWLRRYIARVQDDKTDEVYDKKSSYPFLL